MDKVFIDSNIWIYAFITADDDLIKRETCIRLLENLYQENVIVVSTQVINEVHWNLVRKYDVKDEEAKLKIDLGLFRISKLSILNKTTYDNAFILRQRRCCIKKQIKFTIEIISLSINFA